MSAAAAAAAVEAILISRPEDAATISGSDEAKIFEFEDIASYNWLDKADPTILVPGSFTHLPLFPENAVFPPFKPKKKRNLG